GHGDNRRRNSNEQAVPDGGDERRSREIDGIVGQPDEVAVALEALEEKEPQRQGDSDDEQHAQDRDADPHHPVFTRELTCGSGRRYGGHGHSGTTSSCEKTRRLAGGSATVSA